MLLIFGMPRSGTTWLGKIFDSHPNVLYLHEPDSEKQLKRVPLLVTNNYYSNYRKLIWEYCSNLLSKCTTRVNGKTPFFNKSYLSTIQYLFFKLNLLGAKVLEKFGLTIAIWNPYVSNVSNNVVVVWKSIESCGRLGLIMNALQDCKTIYIIRHPCGQIASVLKGEESGKFSSDVSASNDYALIESLLNSKYSMQNDLTLEEIKKMDPIARLAVRWVLFNEQALEDIELSGVRGMIIRYEDICVDPTHEIKKMFNFAGLKWNNQTKKFIEHSISNHSSAYYSVFKNPEAAMSKWKTFFTNDEIDIIKKIIKTSNAGKLFVDNF